MNEQSFLPTMIGMESLTLRDRRAGEYRRFADKLVLVSVSAKVLPPELYVLLTISLFVSGYDFGSWRAGLEAIGTLSGFGDYLRQ